jgi:hypothetical protein
MRKLNTLLYTILPVACIITLFSCQREVEETLSVQPPVVSSKDPSKLSAAIKVWHGTRTAGKPPSPTGNLPAINPTANPSILAINGRYAIIKPEVTAGEIAGYYIGIPGAGQYFKIDYSKPRNIAGRGLLPRKGGTFQPGAESNADSSIVIVLPPSINVPDTFCVTYCPYDSLGNIGQPVTTCIYVSSLGTSPNNGWLQNDFRVTASWDVVNGVRTAIDTIIFNRMVMIDSSSGYYCDQTQIPPALMGWATQSGQPIIVADSVKYIKNNIRFAINGAFDYKDVEEDKSLDYFASTCNQFTFFPIRYYADTVTGAYNYSSATKKLILIFEFDVQGIPDPEYWEYELTKLNDNHFILKDPIDNYYIRFER